MEQVGAAVEVRVRIRSMEVFRVTIEGALKAEEEATGMGDQPGLNVF
jgi:hypothetical protein